MTSPYASRPWLSSYAEGVPHDIDEPSQTLPEMIADAVHRYGKGVALEFFGAQTTYREPVSYTHLTLPTICSV